MSPPAPNSKSARFASIAVLSMVLTAPKAIVAAPCGLIRFRERLFNLGLSRLREFAQSFAAVQSIEGSYLALRSGSIMLKKLGNPKSGNIIYNDFVTSEKYFPKKVLLSKDIFQNLHVSCSVYEWIRKRGFPKRNIIAALPRPEERVGGPCGYRRAMAQAIPRWGTGGFNRWTERKRRSLRPILFF